MKNLKANILNFAALAGVIFLTTPSAQASCDGQSCRPFTPPIVVQTDVTQVPRPRFEDETRGDVRIYLASRKDAVQYKKAIRQAFGGTFSIEIVSERSKQREQKRTEDNIHDCCEPAIVLRMTVGNVDVHRLKSTTSKTISQEEAVTFLKGILDSADQNKVKP